MSKLAVVPKKTRPLEVQDPMESRKFWDPVTQAIARKDYKQATTQKQIIEQRQRDRAAARLKNDEPCVTCSVLRIS